MAGNGRRHGRNRRDELALAAADWVIENGLGDLSLRRLAAGLGVSHRMLLYHFGTKDELFQAILRAARTRERNRSAPAPETEPASFAELLTQTWTYLSGEREHAFWRFYFEIHGLALQDPDRYPDVLHEGVHDWIATLQGGLKANGTQDAEANALATLILATFRGLMLDLLQTGERDRVNNAFGALTTLLANASPAAAKHPGTRPRKRRPKT